VVKKAELKQLEEKESEELKKLGKGKDQKVTRAMIEEQREKERIEQLRLKKKQEKEEEQIPENINRVLSQQREEYIGKEDQLIDARSVNEALQQLNPEEQEKLDLHPEKRMKAAFLAYQEKNLPILKEENPGLKFTQLKELLWKQWQKAEENPLNQPNQQ